MRRYKVLGPSPVLDWRAGESFEYEFTADEEAFYLENKFLELLPCKYRNIGGSVLRIPKLVKPNEEFEWAIPIRQEQLLAGHLQRIDDEKPAEKSEKK